MINDRIKSPNRKEAPRSCEVAHIRKKFKKIQQSTIETPLSRGSPNYAQIPGFHAATHVEHFLRLFQTF